LLYNWQAIGDTTDKSCVGYKYSELKLEEISAMPEAEWAEIERGIDKTGHHTRF